jgi:nucleoid DNA-binding protein
MRGPSAVIFGQATGDAFPAWESVVTKKEIVRTIADEIGLTQLKTKEIVQKTFDAIVETLVEDRRIELRNFGVFEVKQRAARKARNPRTGEKVSVPEKFVVTFKPGKEMEERVRELERRAAEEFAERERLAALEEAAAAQRAAAETVGYGQPPSNPSPSNNGGHSSAPTSYAGYDRPSHDASGS